MTEASSGPYYLFYNLTFNRSSYFLIMMNTQKAPGLLGEKFLMMWTPDIENSLRSITLQQLYHRNSPARALGPKSFIP